MGAADEAVLSGQAWTDFCRALEQAGSRCCAGRRRRWTRPRATGT